MSTSTVQKIPNVRNSWQTITCLFVTGIGIGCLVGLSVSPVTSIVITSLTGSAAAIIAALSGLDIQPRETDKRTISSWKINALPLMLLVLGILLGSVVGILTRTQSLFGSDISNEVAKWERAGLQKSRDEIVNRIFTIQYPISSTVSTQNGTPTVFRDSRAGTMLFAVSDEECNRLITAVKLRQINGDNNIFLNSINSFPTSISLLPSIVTDTTTIENIIEQVICPQTELQP